MPALQRIIPPRSKEYWDSLDLENTKQVLEAVKEEFNRPEPAWELHYVGSMSMGTPNGFSVPCLRDCLIFLLCGEFIIKGQGRLIETGCVYRVKDEEWIWLCGTTKLVVMEEGEQRGVCRRRTQEARERILAEKKSPKKLKRPGKLHGALQSLLSFAHLHRP